MNSIRAKYLLDVNALIALADQDHKEYRTMQDWFDASALDWGVCPFTEVGFVRVTTNPAYQGGGRTVDRAAAILAGFAGWTGYRYWPVSDPWITLAAPFSSRIFGHQQVTDSYLLGLAVKHDGVLVTFDKGIRYLAGAEYSRNLLVL